MLLLKANLKTQMCKCLHIFLNYIKQVLSQQFQRLEFYDQNRKKEIENLIPAPKCSVFKEQNGFIRVTSRGGPRCSHVVSIYCSLLPSHWTDGVLLVFSLWRGKSFAFACVGCYLNFVIFSVFSCSCISYHLGIEMAMSKLSYKSKLLGF